MFKRKKKFQIPVSAYEYRMILDALMSSREKLMAQGTMRRSSLNRFLLYVRGRSILEESNGSS